MSINTITYSNKSDINTTATPEVNKVTAANMNEIKSIVNSNANLQGDLSSLTTTDKTSLVSAINETVAKTNYSETETVIGTWINGKPLYRRCYKRTGNLATIATSMTNVDDIINLIVMVSDNGYWRTIPWCYNANAYDKNYNGGAAFNAANGNIAFQAGSGLTSTTKYIAIIEYTKTTD